MDSIHKKTIRMKTTNRLFSLFAAILTTATLMAAVVYEPLVVDSGFNRDCIAEAYTPSYAISPYATSYLYASGITYEAIMESVEEFAEMLLH